MPDAVDNHPKQPSFADSFGKFIKSESVELANEASVTADGSAASEQPTEHDLFLELDVTSNDGDITVTVEESSDDGSSDAWAAVASFSSLTGGATGTERLAVRDLEQYVRVTWTAANMTNGADFTVKAV